MSRRRKALVTTPMAITSDGTVIINVHVMSTAETPNDVLADANVMGRPVFVGVALTRAESDELLRDLGDGVADSVGRFVAQRLGSRR